MKTSDLVKALEEGKDIKYIGDIYKDKGTIFNLDLFKSFDYDFMKRRLFLFPDEFEIVEEKKKVKLYGYFETVRIDAMSFKRLILSDSSFLESHGCIRVPSEDKEIYI